MSVKEIINLEAQFEDREKRLDVFIQESLEDSTKSYVQKLIKDGNIEIYGKAKIKAGTKLKGDEVVIVRIPEDEILEIVPENIPIDIVYEDRDLLIINKEPGIVVHPAPGNYNGTLVNAIMYHIKDLSTINGVIRPGIVHRLDKDTSGLIIVAKNDESHLRLTEMFKDKTVSKTYMAICKGNFSEKAGRVENLIGRNPKDRKKMAVVEKNGKTAISNYEVISEVEGYSLVKVGIETGRTHQIRVHMNYLNHPILGDSVYGRASKLINRQMLHAYRLEFVHPITGEDVLIIGRLPDDFRSVLKNFKFDGVEEYLV